MNTLFRAFSLAGFAIAAFAPILTVPVHAATESFNGNWSVEVITEKGSCDRGYRWDVAIQDGRIVGGPGLPAQANGTISPKGAIRVAFSRGTDRMSASGSASGKWATGVWSSPSLGCSGRWRGEHRG